MGSSNAKFDLFILGARAKRAIKEDISILAKDKKDAINTIDEYIQAEVSAGGRFVDGRNLNQFKRNLWQDSFSMDKSKVTNDTLFKVGHEAKTMIEQAHPDGVINSLNIELGKYASAIRFLNKANGRNIKGGMLGKLMYKGIGAIAGSTVGGAFGTIAGAEIAGKASDVLRNPSLKTGMRQKVLTKLKPKD